MASKFSQSRQPHYHDSTTMTDSTVVPLDPIVEQNLGEIYGTPPAELVSGLQALLEDPIDRHAGGELWDENDVVLITYADQIRDGVQSPLAAQTRWLRDNAMPDRLSCVHLLPFCPYTSDDGFSVVDYLAVDPASGDWEDIDSMGQSFDLMFDLVLNHSSQAHAWFQSFLRGDPRYADYYVTADPSLDYSGVVRPRSLPLLTPFDFQGSQRHVWTTFSDDQVDLNYANPRVMLDMIDTLLQYSRRGGRIIRLDAIAYLWKTLNTSCIHLPQTHATVRLMRRVLDLAAPGTLVLTETNVPHAENISYLGDGTNAAHMVYQFSLPPLLLEAVHSGHPTLQQRRITTV
ncbi:MAG: alpha-amylase family glycosyl hydrolase, partial [Planctomycetota bacterium]